MFRHLTNRLFSTRLYATTSNMTSTLSYSPLPLPSSANPVFFQNLGREVKGFDPASMTDSQLEEIQEKLYKVSPPLHSFT